MNESVSELLENIRDNLTMILTIIIIVLILFGFTFFTINSVLPQWRLRSALLQQLSTAEASVEQSEQTQQTTVNLLKSQIENSQERMTNAADFLLTKSKADQFVNSLYQYASEANVEIAELQTVNTPSTGSEELYEIIQLYVQVNGPFTQLTDFLTNIQEVSHPGYSLTDLTLIQGEPQSTLTMSALLYTSPFATDDGLTITQNGSSIIYVVRPGDTLLSIAQQYNVPLAAIRDINSLNNTIITPNQELIIPQ